jgi:hypothetical protein
MSDSIFNLFNKQPAAQTPQNNFLNFVQQVRQNGISPEQTVRQLVSSGRMSQEQFNQLSQIANQILGRK